MKKENHILNELKELAPLLANLPKAEGYAVPEGYWSRMEQDILAEIDIEAIELPLLENKSVPEGYFEGFNDKIFARIDAAEEGAAEPETKVFSLREKLKPLMGIAASLLLVGFVMYKFISDVGLPTNTQQASLAEFVQESNVFDASELAFLDGDIEAVLFEEGVVEALGVVEEDLGDVDDILDEFFEDEELNELLIS